MLELRPVKRWLKRRHLVVIGSVALGWPWQWRRRRSLLRQFRLFDPVWYRQSCVEWWDQPIDPLLHYLALGRQLGREPVPGFHRCGLGLLTLLQRLEQGDLQPELLPSLPSCEPVWQPQVDAGAALTPGLTLCGALSSETGLGQAARNLTEALDRSGLSPRLYDLPMLGRQGDDSFKHRLDGWISTDTVLLVLPLGREALAPLRAMGQRRVLLYPSWELEQPPDDCVALLLQHVDGFWAPSSFIAAMLRHLGKPVTLVPQPMRIPPDAALEASRLREGQRPFTVLTYCDLDSYPARKNPLAAVAAFQRAFPGRQDLRLRVKVRGRHGRDIRQQLRQQVAVDSRLQLLDQTLSRQQVDQLLLDCDCFLSLHRSEGVGFGPAEALASAKPVVTTHYGGVTDFIHPETAWPVGYERVPIRAGDYPFGQGQFWAEPRLEEAVAALRWIEAHREAAQARAVQGRRWLQEHQSIEAMARRLRKFGNSSSNPS